MRMILWGLGSLFFCAAVIVGLFDVFTYVLLGAWDVLSADTIWAKTGGSQGGLSGALLGILGKSGVAQGLHDFVLRPVLSFSFSIGAGITGLLMLWAGRYRRPDYF